MATKHKHFGRFFSLAALFLIVFPLLVVAVFIPNKAKAADPPSLVTKATAYGAGKAIIACANKGFVHWKSAFSGSDYSLAEVESGDIWENAVRGAPNSFAGEPAGYLTDPTDGITDCTNDGDVLQLFTAIGHKGSMGQFLSDAGILTLSGDKAGYNLTDKSDGERSDALKAKIESEFSINLSNPMPQDMAYAALRAAFEGCKPTENASGVSVKLVDSSGAIPDPPKTYAFGSDGNIAAGYGLPNDGGNDGELACTTIAKSLNDTASAYSTTVKAVLAAGGSVGAPGAPTATGAAGATNSCESGSGALGWLACPLTNTVSGALNWVDTQLNKLLVVDRNKFTSPELYTAWSRFRNIALVTLVPIMMVMVIGTAIGVNAFDAYTVKKAMPRLVASVVFISLSWYICVFLIDMFNVIGMGVLGIMTSPFNGVADSLTSLFSPGASTAFQIGSFGFVLGAVTLTNVGLGLMFSWLGTAFLVMLVSYVVLIARQLIIIVAVLFAPLAILSWIFPSNNKLWKLWWETFSKLLIMYPMVMALLAAGRIFAATANFSGGAGIEGWLVNPLIKLTAYVLPYALIPFTFKAAGGIFSSLTGMVNDRSKGAFDRLRKGRQETYKRGGELAKSGRFFRGGENALNTRTQQLAHINKAGLRPSRWGANLSSAINTTESQEIGKALEDAEYAPIKGDDNLNRAMAEWADEDDGMDVKLLVARLKKAKYAGYDLSDPTRTPEENARSLETINQSAATALRMRKKMSGAAFEQMSVGQAIAGGTTYSADEAWEAAARAAHGNQAALAAMVAKGRSSSMSAGRVDVGGAGFGATLNYANDLGKLNPKAANYEQQKADLTAKFHEKVLEGQGPGVLGHSSMKPQAIKALIEPLRDRVLSARAQAVQTGTAEDRAKYDRELGILAGVYDSVAASSPQNARILADGFPDDPDTGKAGQAGVLGFALGRDQNGRPVTIRDEIETARNSNSAAFLEVRREINAQTREGNTVGGVGTGTGGIPGPPTVPTL